MSLDCLVIYQSSYPKIRVGSAQDGGYIIADKLTYDCLISCGVANDINFEKEFLLSHSTIPCFCFDGTIESLPEQHDGIVWIKKNITSINSETTTNLKEILENYKNILLKMDIETYEFRWLQSVPTELLKNIKQIIIEFHFPFTDTYFPTLDIPLPVCEKMDILRKLIDTHTLIHLHPNNCCGTTIFENTTVPNVFECTYLRKDIQSSDIKSKEPIPGPLDRPNVHGADISLEGYPFVHT